VNATAIAALRGLAKNFAESHAWASTASAAELVEADEYIAEMLSAVEGCRDVVRRELARRKIASSSSQRSTLATSSSSSSTPAAARRPTNVDRG
jgi:hypothetical protein